MAVPLDTHRLTPVANDPGVRPVALHPAAFDDIHRVVERVAEVLIGKFLRSSHRLSLRGLRPAVDAVALGSLTVGPAFPLVRQFDHVDVLALPVGDAGMTPEVLARALPAPTIPFPVRGHGVGPVGAMHRPRPRSLLLSCEFHRVGAAGQALLGPPTALCHEFPERLVLHLTVRVHCGCRCHDPPPVSSSLSGPVSIVPRGPGRPIQCALDERLVASDRGYSMTLNQPLVRPHPGIRLAGTRDVPVNATHKRQRVVVLPQNRVPDSHPVSLPCATSCGW